jgi:hypothetical protein
MILLLLYGILMFIARDLGIYFEDIIEESYSLFSNYKIENSINFNQEYSGLIKRRLLNNRLTDISFLDLKDYYGSPYSYEYSDNEVKYFLPRLIDLFIHGYNLFINELEVFYLLDQVSFWNANEVELMKKFSLKYFNTMINYYFNDDILNLFFIFRCEVFSSNRFLDEWLELRNIQSLIAFSEMLSSNGYFENIEIINEDIESKIFLWSKNIKVKDAFENIVYENLDEISLLEDEIRYNIQYMLDFYWK